MLDAERRADRAEALINETKAAVQKQIEDLKHENGELRIMNENLARRVELLYNQKAEAEKKALPASLKNTLICRLENVAEKSREHMASCAETMSDFSDCPQDIGFIDAAKWYKIHKNEAIRTESLIEQLKNF